MKKKNIIAALATVILMTGLMPVAVFAHGHNGSNTAAQYSPCNVENCNTVGNHKHNGTTYTGHTMNDGHDYHQLCNVDSCTKTGSHKHNGTICLPHTNGNSHTNHSTSGGYRGSHH